MITLTAIVCLSLAAFIWWIGRGPRPPCCDGHHYHTFERVLYITFWAGHVTEHMSIYGQCVVCGCYYAERDSPSYTRFNITSDGTVEGTRRIVT